MGTPGSARWLMYGLLAVLGIIAGVVGTRTLRFPRQESTRDVSELFARIHSLRVRAEYDSAHAAAQELRIFARETEDLPPYVRGEAQRLIETLETIRRMPRSQQLELAVVDALDDSFDVFYRDSRLEAFLAGAEAQVGARERLLGPGHRETGESHYFLASALDEAERPREAEDHFLESLRLLHPILEPVHPFLDRVYNDFAYCLADEGRLPEAEVYYRQSLAIGRALGADSLGVATTLNNLGDLCTNLGRFAPAEQYLQEALQVRTLGRDSSGVAQTLTNLGVLYLYMRRYEDSESHSRRALSVLASLSETDSSLLASASSNLASALQSLGRYDEAATLYRQVLALRTARWPAGHPGIARTTTNLANVLTKMAAYDSARVLYDRATAMLVRFLGQQHPDVLWVTTSAGDLEFETGDYDRAMVKYSEAARIYEVARCRFGERAEWANYRSPYLQIAACELKRKHGQEAWAATEHALGRSLADRVIGRSGRNLTATEVETERELAAALREAEALVAALAAQGKEEASVDERARMQRARARLARAEADWSRFQLGVEERHSSLAVPPLPLSRIQAALREDEGLLGWVMLDEGEPTACAWGYVVRKHGPIRWVEEPLRRDAHAESPASTLRQAIVARRDPTAASARVYRSRIAPLEDALRSVSFLVVIPAGDMLGIPVEAVGPAPDSLMLERFSISYVQSATLFAWLRESEQRAPGAHRRGPPFDILALVDPPFDRRQAEEMRREASSANSRSPQPEQLDVTATAVPDSLAEMVRTALDGSERVLARLPRLRAARLELAKLQELASPRSILLSGEEASEARLAALAASGDIRRFSILHFGTHAMVDALAPERSFLVLSQVEAQEPAAASPEPGAPNDGFVSVQDILREWKLEADLVTLSACETGLGMATTGEGYLGFTHAILEAGAQSVLVTLWSVSDRSTAQLVARFYDELAQPQRTKAEALSAAKRWMRNREEAGGSRPRAHPAHWAGVVLVGAPE